MSENKNNKMLKGVAIIGGAGIVVKILGALFRIPLTNWVGQLGMSYYQVAYIIYSALLVMATAGFPVAISRMVSENNAQGKYKNSHKVFKVSIAIMGTIGLILSTICYFGAGFFTERIGNPNATLAVQSIALALFFVPLLSSIRGFFQGRQNMKPTAISEIVEQLVRVFVGLILAKSFLSSGLPQAAAGAAFGASVGAGASLAIMLLIYFMSSQYIRLQEERGRQDVDKASVIAKKIFTIAIPIIIGAEVVPIMNALDMGIVMRRLQATGWSEVESQGLYGLISGYCSTLVNLPQFLIQAIAISIVPAIARAAATRDENDMLQHVELGYRLTMLIAFPCAMGIFALAKPILWLMYPARIDEATAAAPTLMILSLSIITLAVYETTTGVLQAVGKQVVPVKNLAIGAVIKIALSFVLVGIPSINIKGAAISTVIAYGIASFLNNRAVDRYIRPYIHPGKTYIRPLIASAVMGAGAFLVHFVLSKFLGNSIACLLGVLTGVFLYMILVIGLKIVTPQDLEEISIGRKLNRLINKFIKWEA